MRGYNTVFAGVDFTPLGKLAMSTAVELATYLEARRVHLVHVASATPGWAIGPIEAATAYANAADIVFDASKRALEDLAVPPTRARVTRETRSGVIARELATSAREHKADIVVVASHRRGRVGRFVLGSVASTLVRASPCPVLVIGEDRPLRSPIRRMLAAIDGSAMSEPVLHHAVTFAAKSGAALRILSVFDVEAMLRGVLDPMRPALAEMVDLCEARYRAEIERLAASAAASSVDITIDVRDGDDPRQIILDVASAMDPDLIVIGTSGHNAWERMVLGSTATGVVAGAPSPILVVPRLEASG